MQGRQIKMFFRRQIAQKMQQANGVRPAGKPHQNAIAALNKLAGKSAHAGQDGRIKTFFCHIKKYNKYTTFGGNTL